MVDKDAPPAEGSNGHEEEDKQACVAAGVKKETLEETGVKKEIPKEKKPTATTGVGNGEVENK